MKHLQFRIALVAMLLSFAPKQASAYDFEVDGIYYNVVSMSELTCEVTSGDNEYTGEVNIPEQVTYNKRTFSVTSIGHDAFKGCKGLTSVTIGNSVTSIGDFAFSWCSGLTGVTIPNSVTSIGYYAFSGCSNLASVTIPNSVTTIENYAFNGCTSLETLIIEDGSSVLHLGYNSYSSSVTGEGLFYDCPLKSVYLGRNINETSQQCGYSPFYYNTTLTSVIIGDSVTTIEDYAFSNCKGLTRVTIGNSVTTISSGAFSGCEGLTSLTIGNSVTSIGVYAFDGCSSLTSVTIPNSVTSIGGCAFRLCSSLTSVTIGNSVTTIGYYAFSSCSNLTSVTIPNSVTTIENYAFSGCSNLTSVTIGNSVTTIGNSAFSKCNGLTSVTSLATTAPSASESTFSTAAYLNAMLYVPIGSLDSYKSATCWKNFLMEEKDVSGVEGVKADDNLVEKARYSLDGKMLLAPEKGVNIVKMSDGTTKKVVVK